jgi:hypothetical protein
MIAPIFIKQLHKSLISGSLAQFDKWVVPLAKQAASIALIVAPTDTLGNTKLQAFKRFLV